MISNLVLFNLGLAGGLCVLLPIIALIVWRRKSHAPLLPALWGALCFIVFAQGLEAVLHYFCLFSDNAVSRTINSSALLFMLYAAFAAGIFEECGRFVTFKTVNRKRKEPQTAITTGIGHGGIESIIVAGVGMGMYLVLALLYNSGNIASAAALAGGEDALAAVTESISQMSPSNCLLSVLERISAMTAHISLSVLVFFAANNKAKRGYLPLAILLHALFDMTPGLYQKGIIKSLPIIELCLLIAAALLALLARRIYMKNASEKSAVE